MRYYRFLFCADRYDELPVTTCDLRRDLIFGSVFLPFLLPLLLLLSVIRLFSNFTVPKEARWVFLVVLSFCSFLGLIFNHIDPNPIFGNIIIEFWLGQATLLGIVLALTLAFFIFTFITSIKLPSWLKRKPRPAKVKSPSLIKELYQSAKEKYCKKITYI